MVLFVLIISRHFSHVNTILGIFYMILDKAKAPPKSAFCYFTKYQSSKSMHERVAVNGLTFVFAAST